MLVNIPSLGMWMFWKRVNWNSFCKVREEAWWRLWDCQLWMWRWRKRSSYGSICHPTSISSPPWNISRVVTCYLLILICGFFPQRICSSQEITWETVWFKAGLSSPLLNQGYCVKTLLHSVTLPLQKWYPAWCWWRGGWTLCLFLGPHWLCEWGKLVWTAHAAVNISEMDMLLLEICFEIFQ